MVSEYKVNNLLQHLPSPPINKNGWPWTTESRPIGPIMPDGKPWPRISIITPSYNQGRFIEETIRSVLLQNYPNLEYIIMDGGSTDSSKEIIKKYDQWLTYWVSEKDNGQADAIFRGFEKASGDIIAWINSDDFYLIDAFRYVTQLYSQLSAEFIIGGNIYIDENGKKKARLKGYTQDYSSLLYFGQYIAQPACFWSRKSFFEVGGYDRDLKFAFDYDLFLRLTRHTKSHRLNKYISIFREHPDSKSSTQWHEVGIKEVKELQYHHRVNDIDEDKINLIIKKERLRLLFYKCKSITNILHKPKLVFALIKRSLLYFFK